MYNNYIVQGISAALPLSMNRAFYLQRKPNSPIPSGNTYHNHNWSVGVITGVVSDGAPTRYTNLLELAKCQDAGNMISTNPKVPHTNPITVAEYTDRSRWSNLLNFNIENHSEHESTIAKYSRDIVAGKGDMILWAEDGVLLHKALKAKENGATHAPNEITRAIAVYGLNRIMTI